MNDNIKTKLFAERDQAVVDRKVDEFISMLSSSQVISVKRAAMVERGLPNLIYVTKIKYTNETT